MNTLIIFDLDGTLADTREDLVLAVNLTRKSYNLTELTLEEIVNYVGSGRNNLVKQALKDKPEIDLDEACEKWSEYYSQNLTVNTHLYEGVSEGIEKLHNKGYHLAVCSNKPGDMCRRLTAHFELDEYLVTTIGGGDTASIKPEPEGVFKIIKKAEAKGFKRNEDNIWMIGDHHTDLQVANNSGAKSIFCNYGFGKRDGIDSDFTVNTFDEITLIVG